MQQTPEQEQLDGGLAGEIRARRFGLAVCGGLLAGLLMIASPFLPWVTVHFRDAPTERFDGWSLVADGGSAYMHVLDAPFTKASERGQPNPFLGKKYGSSFNRLVTGPGTVVVIGIVLLGLIVAAAIRRFRGRSDARRASSTMLEDVGLVVATCSFFAALGDLVVLGTGQQQVHAGLYVWLAGSILGSVAFLSLAAGGTSPATPANAELPRQHSWPVRVTLTVGGAVCLFLYSFTFSIAAFPPVIPILCIAYGWRATRRTEMRRGRAALVLGVISLLLWIPIVKADV